VRIPLLNHRAVDLLLVFETKLHCKYIFSLAEFPLFPKWVNGCQRGFTKRNCSCIGPVALIIYNYTEYDTRSEITLEYLHKSPLISLVGDVTAMRSYRLSKRIWIYMEVSDIAEDPYYQISDQKISIIRYQNHTDFVSVYYHTHSDAYYCVIKHYHLDEVSLSKQKVSCYGTGPFKPLLSHSLH